MIWALIAQTFLVLLGYTTALVAAGTFAAVAIANVAAAFGGDWERLIDFTVLAMSLTFQAMQHSIVPSILAIVLTEGLQLRHLSTHLVIGCAVGLLTALPVEAVIAGDPTFRLDGGLIRLSIASAAVGAFFYWAIAGHTAGRWLEIGGFAPERR